VEEVQAPGGADPEAGTAVRRVGLREGEGIEIRHVVWAIRRPDAAAKPVHAARKADPERRRLARRRLEEGIRRIAGKSRAGIEDGPRIRREPSEAAATGADPQRPRTARRRR